MSSSIPTHHSLIKSNEDLRQVLLNRLRDVQPKYVSNRVEINQAAICRDAAARGFSITLPQLSKYIKHGYKNYSLKENQIIWLCVRYGIDISLRIGVPKIENKEIKYKIRPYSEKECLNNLKAVFGS